MNYITKICKNDPTIKPEQFKLNINILIRQISFIFSYSFIISNLLFRMFASRYALTFGEMYYTHNGLPPNHIKNQYSFTVNDLKIIQQRLLKLNPPIQSKLIHLDQSLPQELRKQNESAVLLIPGLTNFMLEDEKGADKLYQQQQSLEYDKKYYDKVMKKTFNRKARYHMIFGEKFRKASEDYKQYTIQDFQSLKFLSLIREKLGQFLQVNEHMSQEYIQKYYAQGVHYYDSNSGLGFHGDDGRKVVIGVCLGKQTTLRFCWRKPYSSINTQFDTIDIQVKHGDIYIMSQKATGNDWKKTSKYRVVHAAGAQKYVKI